jgi:hypothetical protein
MYNHRNNTNRAWAFTLTLLMIFTALFGGFSPLGISGEVGEAYAAVDPPIRTATLDLTTMETTTNAVQNWDWNASTKVLTLSGINLSTASETGIIVPSRASIVVTGANTIESATTPADAAVAGIYSLGDLTIIGDGTLTVTGGATTSYNSYGIQVPASSSDLTISGAGLTVNATGGNTSNDSFGIGGVNNPSFILSNATVHATGGNATYNSYGIQAKDFTMSNGTITATGGNAVYSRGIYSYGATTITGGEINAIGGRGTESAGFHINVPATITGGVVNATGGTATSYSYGILRGDYSDNMEITGGVVNATGGTATNGSYGIKVNVLTISGGTVTATGGRATTDPGSLGVFATGTFTISGGAVTATGDNYGITDSRSVGLDNRGTLTINGGTVTATAISGTAIQFETITLGAVVRITSPDGAAIVSISNEISSYDYIATVSGGSIAATNVEIGAITEDPGSGSSGGSGGGSTPSTVISTNTGSVTENQLKNAAGAAKTGDTVTIQSNRTNEVIFPASGLGSLAEKDNSLTVVTENGTLAFDKNAVSAIGAQATATDIQVMVEDVDKSSLTEDQQVNVGDKRVYDLTVLSGGKLISNFEGGKVSVNIPYELKSGETAEKITVWYMGDDGSLTEITCTYDATTRSVTFVVDHFSKYLIGYDVLAGWMNPFHDVMNDAWYYQAVAYANEKDLMKGQTDTTFGPQIAMTRGMLVTILGRMEGVDTTVYAAGNTFSDVDNHQYYAPYIAWASEKDIVNGMGEDRFAPNAAVTREQMAVMITNYLTFKEQGPTGTWAILLTYGDLDKVSSWANEGVMFMTMKGLMKGMGDDKMGNSLFAPNATSTRAQTAQVMMNLDELLQ